MLLGGTIAFAQFSATDSASAALDRDTTLAAISAAEFDARERLVANVEAKVKSASDAVSALQRKADTLSPDAQKAFKDAHTAARQKADHLKQSLRAAQNAKPEGWTEARSALGARYTVYADALAQLETTANAGNSK
ncbi:MAG: hypothetical protein Q8N18_11365 [Opitutaceae bacterium]|nr:hypothetical protein [Opitutaceae bacterium]